MSAFDALKKNRSKSFEKLTEQIKKMSTKSYSNDDEATYWKPTRDSAGNGFAIIRFLPAPPNEEDPFVQLWDHGFQGPGGWYIQNSLTTLKQPDPVSELNSQLWQQSNDDESPQRKQARKQKRRLHYISNIYVIKDSGNPENEGKVFRFKYGKKIWDKLNDLMFPSFDDETPVDPFDLWEGANFRLKIRQFEGYANYDKSEFDKPGPLFEDDEEMEKIYLQCYSLKEIIDPSNFKSYDELKTILNRVLGITNTSNRNTKTADEEDSNTLDMSSVVSEKTANPKPMPSADDDDDDLAFFKNLVNQ